jgi:hypothetical protein
VQETAAIRSVLEDTFSCSTATPPSVTVGTADDLRVGGGRTVTVHTPVDVVVPSLTL